MNFIERIKNKLKFKRLNDCSPYSKYIIKRNQHDKIRDKSILSIAIYNRQNINDECIK